MSRQIVDRHDVVVVGAGIAGLSAAMSAAEAGASVAVVERAPEHESGGNTRYTESFLRMKAVDEVSDDFEETLLNDFMGYHDPALLAESLRDYDARPALLRSLSVADPDVLSAFAESAGPTLEWLHGFGVEFAPLATPFITTSTTRLAPVGGGLALLTALTEAAREHAVTFYYRTAARDLIRGDDGAVAGVSATCGPGETAEFRGQVVLASGGFQGNPELLARYMGASALTCRPIARGGYYNKGEGIEMALRAGAAACGNYSLFHAEPMDPRSAAPEPAIFIFPYGILVNAEGRRFVDEGSGPVDATYERVTRRIHEQPRGVAYVILDARVDDVPNKQKAIRTDQPPVVADSIADLARALELPVAAVEQTVASYNAACDDGGFDPLRPDGLSTSGLQPGKSNWARPLDSPPFHAYPIIAGNVFTFGGLKVGSSAQVIDRDGDAIPGLYASGEVVGMYFTDYTGSTSVLKGAVFGRLAGAAAAGRVTVG